MGGMDMGRAGWQTACGSDRIWARRKELRGGLVDDVDNRIDSREVRIDVSISLSIACRRLAKGLYCDKSTTQVRVICTASYYPLKRFKRVPWTTVLTDVSEKGAGTVSGRVNSGCVICEGHASFECGVQVTKGQ